MANVYLVNRHYDNGESFEDHYEDDYIMAIFSTREKAEKYIANYTPNYEGIEKWDMYTPSKLIPGLWTRTDYVTEKIKLRINKMEIDKED